MKMIERFSAPNGTLQSAQRFDVASVVVMNPTAYTIGIRLGALDVPRSVAESDFWVPPAMYMAFTVVGREYAMAFMLPQLELQPEGMPTETLVMFLDYSEPVPTFGSIALSTVDTRIVNDSLDINVLNASLAITTAVPLRIDISRASISTPIVNATGTTLDATTAEADDVLLAIEPASTGHTYPYTLPEPRRIFPKLYSSNIRSLAFATISPTLSNLTVTGRESGHVYLDIDPRVYALQESYVMPFYAGIDTTLAVSYTQESDEPGTLYHITGHRAQVSQMQTAQGLSHVRTLPTDIISDSIGFSTVVLAAHPTFVRMATYVPSNLYRTRIRGYDITWDGVGLPGINITIIEVVSQAPRFAVLRWGTGVAMHDTTLDIPVEFPVATEVIIEVNNTSAGTNANISATVLFSLERL